jgi:hypothetical protein
VEAIAAKEAYIADRQLYASLSSLLKRASVATKIPRKTINILTLARLDPDSIAVAARPSLTYPRWLKLGTLSSLVIAAGICTFLLLRWERKASLGRSRSTK